MSNQPNGAGASSLNSKPPAWATPGTSQFSNMNTMLQTAPMASALNTLNTGGQGQASQTATNALLSMGQNGGTNAFTNTAANSLQNVGQVGTGNFQGVYNAAGQPGAVENYLTPYASGQYLNPANDTNLQGILNTSNQQIADNINQMFAAGGRYGSGYNQGAVAQAVGQNTNQLLEDYLNRQQQNQINAANLIQNAQNQGLNTQLGAASGVASAQGQNASNSITAAGALGNLGNAAYGNQVSSLTNAANLENQGQQNVINTISQLPTIQNNKVFDANQQIQAGNALDRYTQTGLNDIINQFTQSDNEPWARLGALISAEQGSAGPYGSMSGSSNSSSFGLSPK